MLNKFKKIKMSNISVTFNTWRKKKKITMKAKVKFTKYKTISWNIQFTSGIRDCINFTENKEKRSLNLRKRKCYFRYNNKSSIT